jgi:hypothetical protein
MKINFSEQIQQLTEQREKYEAKMKEDGKRFVSDAIKTFFAAHPQVEAVRWTQYTPYFNDGDECIFGIGGELMVQFRDRDPADHAFPDEYRDKSQSEGFLSSWDLDSYVPPENRARYEEISATGSWNDIKALQKTHPQAGETLKDDINSLHQLLDRSSDYLKFTFGDHAQVTATAEEITVEGYDHD